MKEEAVDAECKESLQRKHFGSTFANFEYYKHFKEYCQKSFNVIGQKYKTWKTNNYPVHKKMTICQHF